MGKRGGYEADGRGQLNVSEQSRASRSRDIAGSIVRAVPCRSLLCIGPYLSKDKKAINWQRRIAVEVVMLVANITLRFC